ncbi:MAG: Cys/Met metabolism pyridoxal-phosphate-dependent enzyme, partial [Steroidobacteraceae bacterium]
ALREADITPSTIRISIGDEDPRFLLEHLRRAGELALGENAAAFSAGFPAASSVNALYEQVYIDVHSRWVRSRTLQAH